MKMLNGQFDVALGERSYPIYFGNDILTSVQLLEPHIKGRRVLIVTNETIYPLYGAALQKALVEDYDVSVVALPDGERYKTLETLNQVFDVLLEEGHGRDTTLIALGGGVVGDMTGFAAACYQRGVNFIQIPTTLLSQVDSSVGGKTGVNHPLGKNMIGAFKQPQAVVIDTRVLATLPGREFSAGLAEVIKYGLIWDAQFFDWLEQNIDALMERNEQALTYAIKRSCEIKAEVVAADETEQNIRAILNLGHTFGHAIEAELGYGEVLHGEAVAIGMQIAITLSTELYNIDSTLEYRLKSLQEKANLPVVVPRSMATAAFFTHMARDKKVQTGQIRYVLIDDLGSALVRGDVAEATVSKAIEACR